MVMIRDIILLGAICVCVKAVSQVVVNTPSGAPLAFDGSHMQIEASHGVRRGGNLFHDFSELNVDLGQTLSFLGERSIERVVSRVTGDNPSLIDGQLHSEIPEADLYLVNPNGVLFGPNASVKVDGDFVVSTAQRIHFEDGSVLAGDRVRSDLLTSAPVEAFGFVTPDVGKVTFQGTAISTEQRAMSVIGGDVLFEQQAKVETTSGRLEIVSLQAPGTVHYGQEKLSVDGEAGGRIELIEGSQLLTSGETPGPVTLMGGDVRIQDHSRIRSVNTGGDTAPSVVLEAKTGVLLANSGRVASYAVGDGDGAVVEVDTPNLLIETAGQVASSTLGAGAAGRIEVAAGLLSVDGGGQIGLVDPDAVAVHEQHGKGAISADVLQRFHANTGIISTSFSKGESGSLAISGDSLQVKNAGTVVTQGLADGAAGEVEATSKSIRIDGQGYSLAGFAVTGIGSVNYAVGETGGSGLVAIEADQVDIKDQGLIVSLIFGNANGGGIELETRTLSIDGNGTGRQTGLFSNALSATEVGQAGRITVRADQISVRNIGTIVSDTNGPGNAGTINIEAREILLDGGVFDSGVPQFTGIASGSVPVDPALAGPAGSVTVKAQDLEIRSGAQISVNSFGDGDSGPIRVNADRIEIVATSNPLVTGITASIESESATGSAGEIEIEARSLYLLNGVRIGATTSAAARGGNIAIRAEELVMETDDSAWARPAILSETSGSGKGGSISMALGQAVLVNGARISSSSTALGDAGDVTLLAEDLTIDADRYGAFIESRSSADDLFVEGEIIEQTGKAGSITVEANRLQFLGGALVLVDAPAGDAGSVRLLGRDQLVVWGGHIEANAAGRGGDIELLGLNLNQVIGSQITATAEGVGGNIALASIGRVELINATVEARSQSQGGNLDIGSPGLIQVADLSGQLSYSTVNASADVRIGVGGNIRISDGIAVDSFTQNNTLASGAQAGNVSIGVPGADLSSALPGIQASLLARDAQLQERCEVWDPGSERSSFREMSVGLLPREPEDRGLLY